jgi:toxin ParE1/3/4
LLPKARADLEEIWLYTIDEWGATQAERYLDELEQSFQLLAGNPDICLEWDDLTPAVHIYHCIRHLIIYFQKEDSILILRVLHANMDVVRHL